MRQTSIASLILVALLGGTATQLAACGGDDEATEQRIARERREAAKLARQEERIKQLEREARQRRQGATQGSGTGGSSGGGTGGTSSGGGASPYAGFKDCGAVYANSVTTCGFAQNVKNAYFSSGRSSQVTVHSDATGRDYVMSCTSGSPNSCKGGNGAEVRFP